MSVTSSIQQRQRKYFGGTAVLSPSEQLIRRRNYYLVNTKPIDLDLPQAYNMFKRNWSDKIMDQITGCKTIVLDANKKPIADIYFEPDTSIKDEDIEVLFKVIKQEVVGASSVMVAINNIFGEYKRNEKDIKLAEKFVEIGKSENIPVIGNYLITSMSICKLL